MKFGKTIETSAKELPKDWQPYIIQYKQLKKSIKQIVYELDNTFRTLNLPPLTVSGEPSANDGSIIDNGTADNSKADFAADGSISSDAVLEAMPVGCVGVPEEIVYNIE
ncbi:hypothetical protein LPJ66_011962, partial [Kickxella alabastrina]